MTYDSEGLLKELKATGQNTVYAAVKNRLNDDRINGSRESSNKLVQQVQNSTPQNERDWAERMAGSLDMPSGLSALARVQERRRRLKEATSLPSKSS